MNVARNVTRAATPRAVRAARPTKPTSARFQSTSSSAAGNAGKADNSHYAAGLAGGLAAGTVLYATYLMTPSGKMHRTINKGAREAQKKYNEAAKKLQGSTPNVDDAVGYMKNFCYSYVGWVPGGRSYVDAAFKDVDTLRENHREEVNEIVSEAYRKFQDLSRSGFSLESASKAYEIIADISKKLGNIAGDALTSILNNHPQIKEKFGGSIEQLQEMGENYGPEAKKQVDQTWSQVKEVLGGGLTASNLDKVRRLIEDKVQSLKKLGDETWQKGMEQVKPYLDKNTKVKNIVEENAAALKQAGNARELFERAKNAATSNDTGDFEQYVKRAVEKVKSKGSQATGGGLDQYFNMVPNGSEVLSKVQQLREVAEKHKDEGESLLKETMEEVKQVLENKAKRAEEIAEKAKKEAK
ncbi:hypothetical protein F4780DRAFT_314613 [Xylariomycetidae sp. FL0641]|nr:hypothetical protein F4780DRAFT_314613 [Xylariomycetidae sp. FL0641]